MANLGTIFGNVDVTVAPQIGALSEWPINRGYALLVSGGESVTFGSGDVLEVQGYTIAALDGTSGTATVTFNSSALLRFRAISSGHSNNPARFGQIRKFQTGVLAESAPNITSVINLNAVPVEIDATGMSSGTYVVAEVDTLNGSLGPVTVIGGSASIAVVGNRLEITV